MDDLEAHLRAAVSAAAGDDPDGTLAGHLAGLRAGGRAKLLADSGESVFHHAGYLSGHLTRWLAERGRPVDPAMLLVVAAYAAAVADPPEDPFATPTRVLATHVYAALRTEKKHRQALSDAGERMVFGWLLEQAGHDPEPELVAKLERLRLRRHERLGL